VWEDLPRHPSTEKETGPVVLENIDAASRRRRALITGISGQDGSYLVADATKARQKLGWRPTVGFKELIELMVDADIDALGAGTQEPVLRPSHGAA
jgi:nucleoside-diphosphate-sugar epimerase